MVLIAVAALLAGILIGLAGGYWLPPHGRRVRRNGQTVVRRILLPFTGPINDALIVWAKAWSYQPSESS